MEGNCFMDWEKEFQTISDFIEESRDTLPRIVRVEEGFCGVNEQCSLDTTEVLIFHETVKQNRYIASDVLGRKISIASNCQHKVQLIPEDCECEYYTIGDLKAVRPRYFQVLESIPGTNLKAGTLIKTSGEQDSDNCFLNCQNVSVDDSNYGHNVQIPSMLKGRFLPLLDCGDYHLTEVASMVSNVSSLKICFTNQSSCCISDSRSIERLDMLGVLHIEKEYEEEMVFATTLDNRYILIFPSTLDILITPSKEDLLIKNSPYAKSLQTWTKAKRPDLRRFKLLNQENAFFLEMPLMAFDYKKFIRKPTLKPPRPKAMQRAKPQPSIPEETPPPIPPKSPKKKLSSTPFSSPMKSWLVKSSSADDASSIISRQRKLELLGPPPLPPRKNERSRSDSEMQVDSKCSSQNDKPKSNGQVMQSAGCEESCFNNNSEESGIDIEDEDGDKVPPLPNLPPRRKLEKKPVRPTPLPRKMNTGEVRGIKPVPAPRTKAVVSKNSIEPNTLEKNLQDNAHVNKTLDRNMETKTKECENTPHTRSIVCDSTVNGEILNKSVNASVLGNLANSNWQSKSQGNDHEPRPPPLPPKINSRQISNSSPTMSFKWNVVVDIPLDTDEKNDNNNNKKVPKPSSLFMHEYKDESNDLFLMQLRKRPQTVGGSEISSRSY